MTRMYKFAYLKKTKVFFKGGKKKVSKVDYSKNIRWCPLIGIQYLQGMHEAVPILYLSLNSIKNSCVYENEVEI